MKEKVNQHTLGLIVGSFSGLVHLLWALLVASGLAEAFMTWVYWLHFLTNPFQVTQFVLSRALALVLFTAIVGYISGWVLGYLWNRICK